jgi:hypothetical protein
MIREVKVGDFLKYDKHCNGFGHVIGLLVIIDVDKKDNAFRWHCLFCNAGKRFFTPSNHWLKVSSLSEAYSKLNIGGA